MYLTYLPDGPDLTYLTQPYYSMSNIPALQYKTYIYKVPIYIVYVYVTLLFATLLNKRHRTTHTGPRRTAVHTIIGTSWLLALHWPSRRLELAAKSGDAGGSMLRAGEFC